MSVAREPQQGSWSQGAARNIRGAYDLMGMWGWLGASQGSLTWEGGGQGGLSRFRGPDGATQRPQGDPWLRMEHAKLRGDPSGCGWGGRRLLEGLSSLSAHRLPAERCDAEEVCLMSWYTPMPIKNGSVVMRVDVSSNGLGPFIPNKRCPFPIPGLGEARRLWEGLPNCRFPIEDKSGPQGGKGAGKWL